MMVDDSVITIWLLYVLVPHPRSYRISVSTVRSTSQHQGARTLDTDETTADIEVGLGNNIVSTGDTVVSTGNITTSTDIVDVITLWCDVRIKVEIVKKRRTVSVALI